MTQLDLLMNGKRNAAGALLGVLDQGARIASEHEALIHISRLSSLLRSELFRDVAAPEQQLAARYIIGRLAMYTMGEYGEEPDSTETDSSTTPQ